MKNNIEDKTNILDVQVNNTILKDFFSSVNKKDNYKLSINEQELSYEIEQDHIINKTILLKTGCKQYNIDDPICVELPLKKVKDFLRVSKKQDTIYITNNEMDKKLIITVNTLSYKISYVDVQEIAGNREITPIPIVSEDEYVLTEDKQLCSHCNNMDHLVRDKIGFRYCKPCYAEYKKQVVV